LEDDKKTCDKATVPKPDAPIVQAVPVAAIQTQT